MRVYTNHSYSSDGEKHLLKGINYTKTANALYQPVAETYCGKSFEIRKKGDAEIENFDKQKHSQGLCRNCIKDYRHLANAQRLRKKAYQLRGKTSW